MPTAVTQQVQTLHFLKPAKPSENSVEVWSRQSIEALFNLPFSDLMFKAQQVHREHFNPNEVQLSTLLSIKTGGCPEDCGYCPQSVHYNTGVEASKLLDVEEVKAAALEAQKNGASRFCMGAAWREPKDRDVEKVAELVRTVKSLGMEACCTLGMLTERQAGTLKQAGLDYYNHNLDTAPELYGDIITTRRPTLSPCLSTTWCKSKARLYTAPNPLTCWSSFALLQLLASPCLKLVCGSRLVVSKWAKPYKHCVSWPGPIPFFMATNYSPQATQIGKRIRPCSISWEFPPPKETP